eukprot:comp24184_c0_seq1/m.44305 comp24184_c0_seq1/g.44305  ORF comp24184_c0_seq1/g.44305 comp24184_c0_seq1/m.44305 type:complete len:645 (-) comp24184_c0_seq1:156-2090(-)
MKAFASLLAFASAASAATVNIATTDDAVALIGNASAGDEFVFATGEHNIASSIQISKDVVIKGNAGAVIVPGASVAHAFLISKPNIKAEIQDLSFKHRTLGTLCDLAEPFALQANFSLAIRNPRIQNNKVMLEADLGYWYNTRYVTDVSFADCTYLTDGPTATTPKMSGYNWVLYGDTCSASVFFDVAFDKLGNCNVAVDKVSDPKFVKYLADVEAMMKEYVDKISLTKNLRVPVTRDGNAIAKLRVQINREGTVSATITVNYPQADLQAVITKLGVKEVDGVNTSSIIITVNLPAPYTIAGGANGSLTMTNMNIPSSNASNWVLGAGCNNLAVNEICNSTIEFNITSCDLTGQYKALNVPIGCQASSVAAGTCPNMLSNFADIEFFISTNNFCNVTEFNLSALFTLDVVLREDTTYATNRPTSVFDLGATSYWSIRIWTNATGVGLSDADVTAFTRTSDGDCTPYTAPYGDISTLTQAFVNTVQPNEIQMPIPVTAALTCAAATTSSNNITLTWTVLVDYLDGSQRRRRRDVQYVRRNSGELTTQGGFGAKYTASDLAAANQPAGAATSSGSNMTIIIAAVVAVLLVCCCCCCAGVGFFLWRRNKKQQEKEASFSQPTFGTSNVNIMPGQSASTFDMMRKSHL